MAILCGTVTMIARSLDKSGLPISAHDVGSQQTCLRGSRHQTFDFELFGRSRRQRLVLYDFNGSVIGLCGVNETALTKTHLAQGRGGLPDDFGHFCGNEQAIVVGDGTSAA